MKKLFATLLFVSVTALTSLAQNAYLRAHLFSLGEMKDGKAYWNTTTETNVLLELKSNSVEIYSENIQHYHIVGLLIEEETTSVWLCKDDNGINCRLYMSVKPESSSVAITIEYNDYVWMYVCEKE